MNVFENLMADLSERCRVGTDPEFQYPPTYVNESDGLAYCSNCHTPRQIHLDFLGKDTTPWIACNCIKEHYEQEEAMKRRQEEYEYISRLRYDAFPNPTAKHWKFEYDDHQGDTKSMNVMQNYAKNFKNFYEKGAGLLVYGNVGVGKSFASACIVNKLIDKGIPCLMTNFSRVINDLTGMFQGKQEYIDNLIKYDLLVIDDLGVQRATPYANEIVTNVIDARVMSKKPLIVTTNLTPEELLGATEITYQRTLSRLFEHCIPIDFKGTDRRRAGGVKQDMELRQLLGI